MISYGAHVAFLFEGTIRFGYIAAIIQRTDGDGESTQHVICRNSLHADGQQICAGVDLTIKDPNDIADMGAWNKDDEIFRLARRSPLWVRSREQSDAILNPSEPTPLPIAVPVTPPTDPKNIPF